MSEHRLHSKNVSGDNRQQSCPLTLVERVELEYLCRAVIAPMRFFSSCERVRLKPLARSSRSVRRLETEGEKVIRQRRLLDERDPGSEKLRMRARKQLAPRARHVYLVNDPRHEGGQKI